MSWSQGSRYTEFPLYVHYWGGGGGGGVLLGLKKNTVWICLFSRLHIRIGEGSNVQGYPYPYPIYGKLTRQLFEKGKMCRVPPLPFQI